MPFAYSFEARMAWFSAFRQLSFVLELLGQGGRALPLGINPKSISIYSLLEGFFSRTFLSFSVAAFSL